MPPEAEAPTGFTQSGQEPAFLIDLWRRSLRQGTVATCVACGCHAEALIGRQ
jgi:hypothetical protein